MDEDDGGPWWFTLVLVVGVLAFLAAVLAAHRDPATGYEVSIYAATTPAFWVGTGLAVLCALDRKSTRLNSSHIQKSRMPSSA